MTSWCGDTSFLSKKEERRDSWNGYHSSEGPLGIWNKLLAAYPLSIVLSSLLT